MCLMAWVPFFAIATAPVVKVYPKESLIVQKGFFLPYCARMLWNKLKTIYNIPTEKFLECFLLSLFHKQQVKMRRGPFEAYISLQKEKAAERSPSTLLFLTFMEVIPNQCVFPFESRKRNFGGFWYLMHLKQALFRRAFIRILAGFTKES